MAKNTYERDAGTKYKFDNDHDLTADKNTDNIFTGDITDDDYDPGIDGNFSVDSDLTAQFRSVDSESTIINEQNPSVTEFSALSDSERSYRWEKTSNKDEAVDNQEDIYKPKKAKKANKSKRRGIETENDEYYDFEIGNNSVGLKILMSLMLITFIVIISVLIYRLKELDDRYNVAIEELNAAPTIQQLNEAYAEMELKDLKIKQLTDELSQFAAANADIGELVETQDGWVYVVAENDTLGWIAQQNEVSVGQIMEWNNLSNADSIQVGQKLIVRKNEEEIE